MHLTLAKYMHVYVIDRLATQVVAVHHDAKAFLATLLVGQALGGEENVAGERLVVLFVQVVEGGDMLLGDNQKMHWRLGRNVVEGNNLIVFVYLLRRDLPGHDLAK
jgi:hypothetical protein